MDSAGFDTLVQSFGTGSRRDGLRLLMGAALAGMLSGLHDADTAAKRRRRRRKKRKKYRPCKPDCRGKTCGDDGCGGNCGLCFSECQSCQVDTCVNLPQYSYCISNPGRCMDGICTPCGYYGAPCCDPNVCGILLYCAGGLCS
jgi:hypothetical protein